MAIYDGGARVATTETAYSDSRHTNYKTAGFTVRAEYTNYTGNDLYLKTQNNLPFCLEPNTRIANVEERRSHLEIKMTYEIHNNAGIVGTFDLLNGLSVASPALSSDTEILKERITELYARDPSRNSKMNFTFVIYKRIMDDDIRRNKLLYFRECDIVVSKEKQCMTAPHPNSNEGLQQIEVSNGKIYQAQSGVFLKVVDNMYLASVRYYYAGKHLISVPSTNDETKESGVYCTISTMGANGVVEPVTSFLGFDEAEEEIGLYRSQEDAISHGDPTISIKRDEAQSRAEERRLARELQEVKHAADLEKINNERLVFESKRSLELVQMENNQLKESLAIRKAVREDGFDEKKMVMSESEIARKDQYDRQERSRKDYYESRSYERKDTSELLKFIPGLIIGALTAFAILTGGSKA